MDRNITEILIRKLENYPCLYALKSLDYMDREKKSNALRLICADLRKYDPNINVQKVETKIRSLRSQYARELRYQRHNGSIDTNFTPKLWCFKELSFLREHTETKKSHTPVNGVNQETSIKNAIKHVITQIQHTPPTTRRRVALELRDLMSQHIGSAGSIDGFESMAQQSRYSPPESCNGEDVTLNDCLQENIDADFFKFAGSVHKNSIGSNCDPADVGEETNTWMHNFPTLSTDEKTSKDDAKQNFYLAQTAYFQNQEIRAEEKHNWEKKQAAERHQWNMKLYETKAKILQVELELKNKELNKHKH